MVDPFDITKYNRTREELEEFALFCVAVAGKNAGSTARALDDFLGQYGTAKQPFKTVRHAIALEGPKFGEALRDCGFGCYNHRAKAFRSLVSSGLDLRTCDVKALEALYGWGPKTARFFLLHSRDNYRAACLDTHILKHLTESGVADVPKSTPQSAKQYGRLEAEFLRLVPPFMTPAEYDLSIWTKYARPDA
jgi:endonuclease III